MLNWYTSNQKEYDNTERGPLQLLQQYLVPTTLTRAPNAPSALPIPHCTTHISHCNAWLIAKRVQPKRVAPMKEFGGWRERVCVSAKWYSNVESRAEQDKTSKKGKISTHPDEPSCVISFKPIDGTGEPLIIWKVKSSTTA
ncbi:uncharacterized protein G2W53_030737 [Senna tora]|uniref:Uncharacterized protein n=1 Tax=Senna tora TaxID=362788 RepID=A0A834WD88_9FABA|nr:uncharacterized protein G2W53_030737 [Senna tora]